MSLSAGILLGSEALKKTCLYRRIQEREAYRDYCKVLAETFLASLSTKHIDHNINGNSAEDRSANLAHKLTQSTIGLLGHSEGLLQLLSQG